MTDINICWLPVNNPSAMECVIQTAKQIPKDGILENIQRIALEDYVYDLTKKHNIHMVLIPSIIETAVKLRQKVITL